MNETTTVEVEIDVTDAVAWPEPLHTAALVAWSPDVVPTEGARVIAANPGGTHAKEYYDMHIPGFAGYSMAEWFAARGWIFVACDPLGVGASSTPEPDDLATRATFADANSATALGVLDRLRTGEVDAELPALEIAGTIGIGTSMGAMLLLEQQARSRPFDGIVVMGYSGIQTKLATPPPGWALPAAHADHDNPDLFYTLYWEDTPPEVIAADQEKSVAPPMAAVRAGGGYKAAMDPGAGSSAAAAIDTPVLVACGERDTCPDPRAEVGAYGSSFDVSMFVLPRAGHAPCVANTRELLWRRIDAWGRRVIDQKDAS